MLQRRATESPQRVLQAFRQSDEALAAQHDVGLLPTRERQAEVIDPHAHLKRMLQQALLLRGSADVADLDAYRHLVDEMVGHANARRRKALEIERARLNSLP